MTTLQPAALAHRFHLPRTGCGNGFHAVLHAAERDPGAGRGTRTLRILLVDDNEDAVRSLEKLLTALGYEARSAMSGMAALAAGETFHPDVILLDLGMPEMDGFETAAAIRGEGWGRDVRIIALTGWGQQDDMRRTREAGFAAHLVKPLKTYELLQLLQKQ